jgi:hypothetical protein
MGTNINECSILTKEDDEQKLNIIEKKVEVRGESDTVLNISCMLGEISLKVVKP